MAHFINKTTQEFISEAQEIHGIYDYSLVEYIGSKQKVKIICPTHGVFEQTPNAHLNGSGCLSCYNDKRSELMKGKNSIPDVEIIDRLKDKNPDFDILEIIRNRRLMIKTKCVKHGEFIIGYQAAINSSAVSICPSCFKESRSNGLSKFLIKAKDIHGELYNYDKVEYFNNKTPVILGCNTCGTEWSVRPDSHLHMKSGCPVCNKNRAIYTDKYYEAHGIADHSCNLYLVEFSNENEKFIKIGLSTGDTRHRFRGLHSHYEIKDILVYEGMFLNLYDVEQFIISSFKDHIHVPNMSFKGHTECFGFEVKSIILSSLIEILGSNSVNCGNQLKLEDTTHA